MTDIENKALNHVFKIIESIDTYPIYSALSNAMSDAKIADDIKKHILDKYDKAMATQILKVRYAQGWLQVIINDPRK